MISVIFAADFSNILDDPEEKAYFDQILHKARIIVDERGTKAAAVSSISLQTLSGSRADNIWKFDRPFLYAIMDKRYNFPIFIGRVVDPSKTYELSPRQMPNKMMSDQEKDQDDMKSMDDVESMDDMKSGEKPMEMES